MDVGREGSSPGSGESGPAAPAPASSARLRGGDAAAIALVAALSLAVRFVVLADLRAADPLLRVPVLDDRAYLDMAARIAAGDGGPWFLAPLHPWIVAQASRFAAPGMPLACGVNAVLGALASGAAVAAGCRLHSRAAGIAAGLVHALAGVFVFHDVLPGQEPALTLLHLVAVVLAARLADGGGVATGATFGAVVGAAVLGRGTSAALALAAVPAVLRAESGRRLRLAAACAAGLALVLVPAAVRNASVAGALTPLPWSGGPNLYAANGPDARASVSFWSSELTADPAEMERRAGAIAAAAERRELSPAEVDAWWARRAAAERGDAGEFALHVARKAALFWEADERGSNHSITAEAELSPLLRATPLTAWWVLAAGVAGWWVVRPRRPAADGAALVVAGTWILLTLVFPVARFRLPVAALCAVLGAAGAVEIARRAVPARRIAAAVGAFVAVAVVAFLPIRAAADGAAHVNLATAHLAAGDGPAAAEARLRRALDVEPGCGPAHQLLGRILLDRGDAAGAYDRFVAAAADSRTRWTAQVAALPALVALRRLDEAATVARGLLGERRDDPELLANAALVAGAAGDGGEARRLLAEARRIAPSHPAVLRASRSLGW